MWKHSHDPSVHDLGMPTKNQHCRKQCALRQVMLLVQSALRQVMLLVQIAVGAMHC